MALDWQTFRSNLGLSCRTSIFYIDDEGSKIPIDSECEFQEALRVSLTHCLDCRSQRLSYLLKLAYLNKSLNLILCDSKLKPNERPQSISSPAEKCEMVELKCVNAVSSSKENVCCCNGDAPPEWFKHYMKKFKKEVLHDLKLYIHDTVHSAIEKKLSCTKLEGGDLFCERSEFSKLEKAKAILDEKRKLPESKRKLLKNSSVTSSRSVVLTKSASFLQKDISLTVERESEFTIPVRMRNDGCCQWRSPLLVCFETEGVCLLEHKKPLRKLHPRERCSAEVRGKLTPEEGPHYFRCRVVDRETEEISPVFTCTFNVVFKMPAKDSDDAADNHLQDTVGTLIDFEKDVISISRKKIEENISEIERNLRDIDLLQPSTCPGKGSEAKETTDAFQTGCDLIQLENSLRQEDVKSDCAGSAPTQKRLHNVEDDKRREKISKRACYHESSCGSTSMSFTVLEGEEEEQEEEEEEEAAEEEDDDFFYVVPSECLSAAESANEDKEVPNVDSNPDATTREEEPNAPREEEPKQPSVKPKTKKKTPRDTRRAAKETIQGSPTRSRPSRCGEETSRSTKYCFTTANLTQPTFTHTPGFSEGRPMRFTFTGSEEESRSKTARNAVPHTDVLGRTIYAVNSQGYCFPAKEVFRGETKPHRGHTDRREGSQTRQERRNDRFWDNQPVSGLPNALINGASNVASLAFSTAKSVINNLQSAFVTDGKTEMGTPADEEEFTLSMAEAMTKLCEMGYLDIERNQTLLIRHRKNLAKVIDELVRLNEKLPTEERPL